LVGGHIVMTAAAEGAEAVGSVMTEILLKRLASNV